MTNMITLECGKCCQKVSVCRTEDDPPHAVRVEIQCAECNGGDFDEPKYFDEANRHIVEPPEEWAASS